MSILLVVLCVPVFAEPIHAQPGAITATSTAIAQPPVKDPPASLDLFLLIGQSNMAGRAPIEEQDMESLPGVYLLDDELEWGIATNPLNRYSTIRLRLRAQKLGPGYTFAKALSESNRFENEIGLIVNARGGTPIEDWQKGASAGYYEQALARALAAQASGKFRGIIWSQGTRNCLDNLDPLDYMNKLQTMIGDFRSDLGEPDLMFVAAEVGRTPLTEDCEAAFNAMISGLPSLVDHTAVVRSDGLDHFDGAHFDSASQRVFGVRYAAPFLADTGDVNCDDSVNDMDARTIAEYLVGLRADSTACPPPGSVDQLRLSAADVSGDGIVDVADALWVALCAAAIGACE